MLVYADDVALYQWIGPVTVDHLGFCLCAQGEQVVLTKERERVGGKRKERELTSNYWKITD